MGKQNTVRTVRTVRSPTYQGVRADDRADANADAKHTVRSIVRHKCLICIRKNGADGADAKLRTHSKCASPHLGDGRKDRAA
jgi:hypothetical protein